MGQKWGKPSSSLAGCGTLLLLGGSREERGETWLMQDCCSCETWQGEPNRALRKSVGGDREQHSMASPVSLTKRSEFMQKAQGSISMLLLTYRNPGSSSTWPYSCCQPSHELSTLVSCKIRPRTHRHSLHWCLHSALIIHHQTASKFAVKDTNYWDSHGTSTGFVPCVREDMVMWPSIPVPLYSSAQVRVDRGRWLQSRALRGHMARD